MNTSDFTTTLMVSQSPEEVFDAITNVRGWWSEEIEGGTSKLNDVFNYHFKDIHIAKITLTEVIPSRKIVWLVVENYFNFTEDSSEWTGTHMIFDISESNGKTQVRVTHAGLTPAFECYEICSNAWTNYIQNSLMKLITTGKGEPNSSEKPRTADEERLSK